MLKGVGWGKVGNDGSGEWISEGVVKEWGGARDTKMVVNTLGELRGRAIEKVKELEDCW